jgi:PAS domain S-box-containing protein
MTKQVVQGAIAFVILMGVLVLVGWQFEIERLKHGFLVSPFTMKGNTALCFVIAGTLLALLQIKRQPQNLSARQGLKRLIWLGAGFISLVGALTLSQYIFGWNLGIDEWLFRGREMAETPYPGRMAETTALNMILTGVALVLFEQNQHRSDWFAQLLSFLVGLIALVPLTGYVFEASILYTFTLPSTGVSFNTVITFLVLSLGLLLTRPRRGLMRTVSSPFTGGKIARQLLPWTLLYPLLLNWLLLQGEQHLWHDPALAYAYDVFVLTITFSILIWWTARSLNRTDFQRQQAETHLKRLNRSLAKRVAERTAELVKTQTILNDVLNSAIASSIVRFRVFPNRDWQYEYQSPGCETLFGYRAEEILGDKTLWLSRVVPEDVETLVMPLFDAFFACRTATIEYRFQHKDGSLRWISGTYTSRYDETTDSWIVTGVSSDISDRKQIEAALRESEERLQLAFEASGDGLWDWYIATGKVYYSPLWLKMLGYAADELPQDFSTWEQLVHPDDMLWVRELLAKHLQDNRVAYEFDYRLRTKAGTWKWVADYGKVVARDRQGNPLRMIGTHRDIDARKRAEGALRQSEARSRALINALPDLLIRMRADGTYLDFHNNAEFQVYRPHNHYEGITVYDTLPPDLAQQRMEYVQQTLQTGKLQVYEQEIMVAGKKRVEEVRLAVCGRDEILVIVRDITDRKRAEQELELQAVITRTMAEGICLVRAADGAIVYTNPKFDQMFGYSAGELIGNQVSILNYQDEHTSASQVAQMIIQSILDRGEATYEVHNVKKDGTPFWCQATASTFQHPEHGTVFVVIQQDITGRKQAEETITASLKEKEVLLQEIHHRVKNNLGIVSSLLQMQLRRIQDNEAANILRDSQNRIASIALVHEKLYRSQDLAKINFAQYISDLTAHLFASYNMRPHQIQLTIQVDEVCLNVETAIPCGLIINELISNALKYAFPNDRRGEIQVRLYQEGETMTTLLVRDNGRGLPPDFELKTARTLGMTLVQGLVQQLRGTIAINRQQGTEFKVCFCRK